MNEFVNITSNDNWFKQHPEKIAGVEYKTTSIYFPIQVKGTKDDVLRVTKIQDCDINCEITKKSKEDFIKECVFDFEIFGSFPRLIEKYLTIVNEYVENYGYGKSINKFKLVKPTKSNVRKYAKYLYELAERGELKSDKPNGKRVKLAKAKAKALKLKLKLA